MNKIVRRQEAFQLYQLLAANPMINQQINTKLLLESVDRKEIQELMGHLSFETTLQYAHLSEDHVKRQVLKLPFADGWDDARHNSATLSINVDSLPK